MPFFNSLQPLSRSYNRQSGSPQKISKQGERESRNNKHSSGKKSKPKNLSQEKSRHNAALERSNSTARLLDSNRSRPKRYEIALPDRIDTPPMQDFQDGDRVFLHQPAHDRIFGISRPWHGNQKKNNWKKEVPYPSRPAYPSQKSECEANCTKSTEHTKDTPLRIGLKKQSQ